MATLAQNFLSLADIYKRQEGGGAAVADIIETMNDTSQDILTDFVMMECNNKDSHVHTIRTGLPSVSWGALYEGVPQSKSQTQQVQDTTGFVESRSTVDERLLDLAGENRNMTRMAEARPHIEAMAQELVTALFYHDPATNARYPKGLAARMGAIATSGAGNQIVDAGGTGSDNTSIWFVTWGGDSFCGIYPQNTMAGIQQIDRGRQRVTDGNGDGYYAEEEDFRAYCGFALKDWRNVSRVANIDVSNAQAGSVDLYDHLRSAYYKLHSRRTQKVADQKAPGRTVIYMNRDMIEVLDTLATNAGTTDNFVRLSTTEVEGKEVYSYRGIPIRETDALLNTEAQIT